MKPSAEARGTPVLLGLGSNMGDRLRHLRAATCALALHPEIEVLGGSGVYETEYVGPGSQDPYLNACLLVRTGLTPRVLLAVLQGLEVRHGRRPGGHLKPRPLDLDILLFGNKILFRKDLEIPHPRLRERAFVLIPLAEIAFSWTFPDSGETIGAACAKIRRKSGDGVRPLAEDLLVPRRSPGSRTEEDWRAALAVHCR